MPERKINPKFNIHSSYRKLNIINPYRYGSGGGGIDAQTEYQAVLDAAANNGDPLPSSAQQAEDIQLLADYMATGGWDKDDVFVKFKGTADPQFKLYCWKRKIKMEASATVIWSAEGAKGNNGSAFINTLYAPSYDAVNASLNDFGMSYTSFSLTTDSGTKAICGAAGLVDGTDQSLIVNHRATGNYAAVNGLAHRPVRYAKLGFNSLNRISSTQIQIDEGNPISNASGSMTGFPIFILSRNYQGNTNLPSDEGVSFFRIGANNSAEHAAIKTILV